MQQHEVEAIVAATLAEQKRLHKDDIDDVVLRTVVTMLTSFGFEEDERKEMQADFRFNRKLRLSTEAAGGLTFKIIIGTLVSGFLGVVYMGFKLALGK